MEIQKELNLNKILSYKFEGKIYFEQWFDIPGYENIYKISTFGRIKSLKRKLWNGKGWFFNKEIILKTTIDNNGYKRVGLSKDNKTKYFKIHQLIAIVFHNHKPDKTSKIVCDHIDNNKLNNHYKNIQLISSRENCIKETLRKKSSSKYTGVSWDKINKKWRVRIKINGKETFLGRFDNEKYASKIYQNKLKSLT